MSNVYLEFKIENKIKFEKPRSLEESWQESGNFGGLGGGEGSAIKKPLF